jgi:biopolymer transport protein TolR
MRLSGRALRMMTHHVRNRAAGELNLIPMIDILSVLVSFLLVYSTEVEVIQNSKGIEIPQSIVTAKPRETVVVMLTKDDVFVQGQQVGTIAELRASKGPVFNALKQVLVRPRIAGAPKDEEPEITVMADKSLPYEVLKKVMQTATDANFVKISFAAVEKDKPVDLAAGPANP